MKKCLFLISAFCAFIQYANAQYVTIPDTNFRNRLVELYPDYFNSSKQLDTSSEVTTIKELILESLNISDLEGIQYFHGLNSLSLRENSLTMLPKLPQNLQTLDCSYNLLTYITGLPQNLSLLRCYGNPQLYCLPAIPYNMGVLHIDTNNIKCLPNLPKHIYIINDYDGESIMREYPVCGKNNLTCLPLRDSSHFAVFSDQYFRNYIAQKDLNFVDIYGRIDTLNNPIFKEKNFILTSDYDDQNFISSIKNLDDLRFFKKLEHLSIDGVSAKQMNYISPTLKTLSISGYQMDSIASLPESLTELSVYLSNFSQLPTLPLRLKKLNCAENKFTALPTLPDSIVDLNCNYNKLTTLPKLPKALVTLSCMGNEIVQLPTLPEGLEIIGCDHNRLTSLPSLPNSLIAIICANNPDLHCLPYIPQNMVSLQISPQDIRCIPNKPSGLVIFNEVGDPLDNFSLCNTNSICQAYANIRGKVFIDRNHNGVLDSTEHGKHNVKIHLNSDLYTFTDEDGNFSFSADTLGRYVPTIVAPNHFAMPNNESIVFDLNSYDSVLIKNIPIVPTDSLGEVSHSITAIGAAKPGSAIVYQLQYQNTGSTQVTPQVVFNFDKDMLLIDSLSVPYVFLSDAIISIDLGTLNFEQNGTIFIYASLKTTVQLEQKLSVATVLSTPDFIAKDSTSSTVIGVFDSNHIEATENLKPEQLSAGEFIAYTIRFQNNGTGTVENIVIQDTLSKHLQSNSLELIASSHKCKTSVNQGLASFRFENIELPNHNQNELESHGFVRFKVKPSTFMRSTDVVENTAYIYFDNKEPITTNTSRTTFLETVTLEQEAYLKSKSYIYPNPATDRINVVATNSETLYIYNSTGILVYTELIIGTKEVSISNLKSGLYIYNLGNQTGKLIVK